LTCTMQRRTTQKILGMIPPESSESSGNESSDKHVDYASNFDSSSSSLSANTDENELDELLKDFELNPIDEATREFFDSIDENIIEEEISTTNFSPTFVSDISKPSTSGTSPLPETEFVSPQPSTSAAMSSKSKQLSTRTSKRILNYNVRTPPIPLSSPQPSTLPEAQFVSPRSSRKRYNKTTKSIVDVSMPQIVKHYNSHLGGVDLADMLIAIYRTNMKTHQWYLNIFSQLLDVCVNNAWLQYRKDCVELKEKNVIILKEFRVNIAIALSSKNKPKVGRKSKGMCIPENIKIKKKIVPQPIDDVRLDRYDHMPIVGIKGRCRMCKTGQTTFSCDKCDSRLCITSTRN
ncbi:hypothetical protein AGLY_017893, partial [Aphis glycines]